MVTTDDLFNLLPPESQKKVLDLVNKDVERYKNESLTNEDALKVIKEKF